jgi:hypothetical protein
MVMAAIMVISVVGNSVGDAVVGLGDCESNGVGVAGVIEFWGDVDWGVVCGGVDVFGDIVFDAEGEGLIVCVF